MLKIGLSELPKFVRQALASLEASQDKSRAALLTLCGDLGAGKTTFVQALAKELGVGATVQSPTYVLVKSYETKHPQFKKLVHIDLYRLEKPEELAALKLEEVFNNPNNLVCIEWPERAPNSLPKPTFTVNFSSEGTSTDERYIELV